MDSNATLVAGGGQNATPNNLERFSSMMIYNGKFSGKQVINPIVIRKIAEGGYRSEKPELGHCRLNSPGIPLGLSRLTQKL